MTFGGPPEFKTRPDGIPGLKKNYGVEFGKYTVTDTGGPVTVNALKRGQIQAADLFTTDPSIAANNFVVLEDPKSNFAAQNVVPIINKAKATAGVKQILNGVQAKLTTTGLADLVGKVQNDKQDPKAVAQGWLKDQRPRRERHRRQGLVAHRRLGQLPGERHPGRDLRRRAGGPGRHGQRRKLNIGSREKYFPALKAGSLDLFPEYTGVTLQYLDKTATATTPDDVYAALTKALPVQPDRPRQGPGRGQGRDRGHQGDGRQVQPDDDRRPGQEELTLRGSLRSHLRDRSCRVPEEGLRTPVPEEGRSPVSKGRTGAA